MVSDLDNHPVDLIYFKFCNLVNATDIDNRAPNKSLFFKFSLRSSKHYGLPPNPWTPNYSKYCCVFYFG